MKDTIKIGDKQYETESVTDLAIAIMKDVKTIDDQITSYGVQLSIAKLAKSKLIEELQKELPKMTEVVQEEEA
jgi:hypothetical protein